MKTLGIVLFYAFLVISVTAVIISLFKTKKVSAFIITVLQGVGALFAVNFVGSFIGVHLPVNAFSVSVSSLGGTSGVILLLVAQVLFR